MCPCPQGQRPQADRDDIKTGPTRLFHEATLGFYDLLPLLVTQHRIQLC